MPVRFLTDAQREQLSGFPAELDSEALDRFFTFSDADLAEISRRNRDGNRVGFVIQLGTVRFLGTFLPDPLDVPTEVVAYQAGQLRIGVSGLRAYAEREMTPFGARLGDPPRVRVSRVRRGG